VIKTPVPSVKRPFCHICQSHIREDEEYQGHVCSDDHRRRVKEDLYYLDNDSLIEGFDTKQQLEEKKKVVGSFK
jgi:hypothetical protein